MKQTSKKVVNIYVEFEDGSKSPLNELNKQSYETFLDNMIKLRLRYYTLLRDKNIDNDGENN